MAYEYPASNQSYTNKDFQSIFPELLDVTKKLTNKYDPQLSNESDPMIVLYKLLAFIGDKNNYNIDKNVLETFPLSVTQYGNARQLYDSLGYQPHWYRAASLLLSLELNPSSDSENIQTVINALNNNGYIKIPKFTMFSDSDGKYIYTTVADVVISSANKAFLVEALNGTLEDYTLSGASNITLSHMDADFRIYFSDRFVAENGIFICNTGEDDWDQWKRIDNLERYPAQKTVYKFGVLPNSDTCYLQFPLDIANLIKGGLTIKYLSTSGASGNVSARTIDQFYQELKYLINDTDTKDLYVSSSDISVKNVSSSMDGEDPEDLESQYRNYKKQVGTFNTLVTLRDYDNAIYNATDGDGKYIISNGVTSDRTNDPHFSNHVVHLTDEGDEKELVVSVEDGNGLTPDDITYAFDANKLTLSYSGVDILVNNLTYDGGIWSASLPESSDENDPTLTFDNDGNSNTFYVSTGTYNIRGYATYNSTTNKYGVTITYAYKSTETTNTTPYMTAFDLGLYVLNPVESVYNTINYNKSFTAASTKQYTLQTAIEDMKSANHDYIDVLSYDPYLYKNFYALNGKVITYSKVTTSDARQIEDNIRVALYKNFNARQVDFGKEIEYNKIIEVIKEADNRISTVILDEPQYILRYLSPLDNDGGYSASFPLPDTLQQRLLERMVVNGTVQLFEFNHDFKYDFGEDGTVYSNVTRVDTLVTIPEGQIQNPAYLPLETFPEGYTLKDNEIVYLLMPNYIATTTYGAYIKYTSTIDISKDTYYAVGEGELKFTYKDTNGVLHNDEALPAGTIIKSTFGISLNGRTTVSGVIDSGDLIDVLKENRDVVGLAIYAYWVVNNLTNNLFPKPTNDTPTNGVYVYERVLDLGEYFIYTSQNKTELVVLGSGTRIEYKTKTPIASDLFALSKGNVVEDIIQNGLSAIDDDFKWYTGFNGESSISDSGGYNLIITEMQIIALGAGASIYGEVDHDVTNEKQSITNAQYKESSDSDSDWKTLTKVSGGIDGWEIYSRLAMITGPDLPQELKENQTITIYQGSEESSDNIFSLDTKLKTSQYIEMNGGNGRVVLQLTEDSVSEPIKVLSYQDTTIPTISDKKAVRSEQGYYEVITEWNGQNISFSYAGISPVQKTIIPFIKHGSTYELTVTACEDVKDATASVISGNSLTFSVSSNNLLPSIDLSYDSDTGIVSGSLNDTSDQKTLVSVLSSDTTAHTSVLYYVGKQSDDYYAIHATIKYDIDETSYSVVSINSSVKLVPNNGYVVCNELGSYFLTLNGVSSANLHFAWDDTDDTNKEYALMGYPYIVTGYSEQIKNASDGKGANWGSAIETDIVRQDSPFKDYDLTYEVPDSDKIEAKDVLSGKSFFDPNNQFSAFTIPQINTTEINVTVSAQSKK